MNFMAQIFLLFLAVFFSNGLKAFQDVYSESAYLSQGETWVHSTQLRVGRRAQWIGPNNEVYAVGRMVGDSRTLSEEQNIYNDNAVFLGLGFDVFPLWPGFRWTNQLGYSWDMAEKIDRQGVDFRTGLVSYHERLLSTGEKFYDEWYSEALYQHRFENVFVNVQSRWSLWQWQFGAVQLSPRYLTVVSFDAQSDAFSRYVDQRLGLQVKVDLWNAVQLNVTPQVLQRWFLGSDLESFQEFRVFVWLYKEF